MTKLETQIVGHSGFDILSSLVIRHSSFYRGTLHVTHNADYPDGRRPGDSIARHDARPLSDHGRRRARTHGARYVEDHPVGARPEHRNERQAFDNHTAG